MDRRCSRASSLTVVALAVVITAACAGPTSEPSATPDGFPTLAPLSTVAASPAFGSSVTFSSADGTRLHGLLLGDGAIGVVLAHQLGADADSWVPLATPLADAGYLVLALDFRGFGQSEGQLVGPQLPADVAAAADFLREQGAGEIVLIGASMGGIAAREATATEAVIPAALVTLSAPQSWQGLEITDEELHGMEMPKLFVNTDQDDFILNTRRMVSASDPVDQEIYPGRAHGTQILGDAGEAVVSRIIDFLEIHAPGAP